VRVGFRLWNFRKCLELFFGELLRISEQATANVSRATDINDAIPRQWNYRNPKDAEGLSLNNRMTIRATVSREVKATSNCIES
jgi:hypothetical protein